MILENIVTTVIGHLLSLLTNRTHLKVRADFKRLTINVLRNTEETKVNTVYFCVKIINPSEKTIHVESLFLAPTSGRRIELFESHPYDVGFEPFALEPRRNRSIEVHIPTLVKSLTEGSVNDDQARVIVVDELGKEYKSNQIELSTRELSKEWLPQAKK